MASMVIPNRRQGSKDTIPEAKTKSSKAARPRRSGVSSAALAAADKPPSAAGSSEQRDKHPEREQLLEYARVLLEPRSSRVVVCDAEENLEKPIFLMNRAALGTMNVNPR